MDCNHFPWRFHQYAVQKLYGVANERSVLGTQWRYRGSSMEAGR